MVQIDLPISGMNSDIESYCYRIHIGCRRIENRTRALLTQPRSRTKALPAESRRDIVHRANVCPSLQELPTIFVQPRLFVLKHEYSSDGREKIFFSSVPPGLARRNDGNERGINLHQLVVDNYAKKNQETNSSS